MPYPKKELIYEWYTVNCSLITATAVTKEMFIGKIIWGKEKGISCFSMSAKQVQTFKILFKESKSDT